MNNVCTIDCPNDIGYLGNDGVDKCLCDTAKGYKLITESGPYQNECTLDCSKVQNSPMTNFNRTFCNCKDDTY